MAGRLLAVSACAELFARLSADPAAQWTVLAGHDWPPEVLCAIEVAHPGRRCSCGEIGEQEYLRADVEGLFDAAARHDRDGLFPSAAGVPLGIPGWSGVEALLRLRSQSLTTSTLLVLARAGSLDNGLVGVLTGCSGTMAFVGMRSLFARLGRTMLRRLCSARPSAAQMGRNCWVTVGAFLADAKPDTYYARWPWQAAHPPLRIYQQGGRAVRLPSSLEQMPLEALLHWSDILGALQDVRAAVIVCRKLSREDFNQQVLRWLWLEEIRRGEVFTLALQKRAWKRLLADCAPRIVVLPYEARAWERSLVRQARASRIPSVGYQHSSLTPRHHAVLVRPARESADWVPDRILCCGEVTAERLAAVGSAYQGRLHVGVALRTDVVKLPPPGPAVLVALSSSRHEATALFRMFAAACKDGLCVPLIFRAHPTIPVRDLFDAYEWPVNTRFSQGRSLNEDLSGAWCVAYSSATVSLEGMRYERIPLYVNIGDILSGDPLDEGLPCKLYADSAGSLVSVLHGFLHGSGNKAQLSAEASRYAEKYLIQPTDERIAAMSRWLEQK
jgi:hypothetical protein